LARVILGVTISLDGFAEDNTGSVGALYPDLEELDKSFVLKAEDPDWFAGNYEYQVPIFVFAEEIPKKHPKETDTLTFTFVTKGIENAVQLAKTAAGEKDVTIIGSASTVAKCIRAQLADELQIDVIPLLLHRGFKPFDNLDEINLKLNRLQVAELPAGRVHIRYQIIR
jgi:dihydrofolate reductase